MTGPIVSAAHLVSAKGAELSEFEYGLIVASQAFQRWITRCAAAAGNGELAPLEVLVLHSVNHREREKKLADLCFVLNIEEAHTVTYACRKLQKSGLVTARKRGKEVFYRVTARGRAACKAYAGVREACLMDTFAGAGLAKKEVARIAASLRALSGLYDQAARSATAL